MLKLHTTEDPNDRGYIGKDNEFSEIFFFGQIFVIQTMMWIKLFDWLRLFSKTAIYPVLLNEVLKDIAPYSMMMAIIFGVFGNFMFIYHAKILYDGSEALKGLEEDIGMDMFTHMMNELLIMAGEYHYEDFKQSQSKLQFYVIWLCFMLAIIMTQVVFLNTLIAIISDTFERVWDKKNQIIVSSKADLLCDWLSLRGMIDVDINDQFLYVI